MASETQAVAEDSGSVSKMVSLRKFATTSYTRAKQYASERLGRAEMTEYDEELQCLIEQTDKIKGSTERSVNCAEALFQPDVGARLEEKLQSTIQRSSSPNQPRKARKPKSPFDLFGAELLRRSALFGSTTPYGAFTEQCGLAESKIGQAEKRFQEKGQAEFIAPLKAFLEVDVKNAMRERRALNIKRIDLDAAKGKVKRTTATEKLQAAEAELRVLQHGFDEQVEVTRSALKKIVEANINNFGNLHTLLAAQREFYAECVSYLSEVNPGAGSTAVKYPLAEVPSSFAAPNTFIVQGIELDRDESRKARVLYDYDADNEDQLSVTADQAVMVTPIPNDADYFMAEVDGKFGRVPSTYVQLL